MKKEVKFGIGDIKVVLGIATIAHQSPEQYSKRTKKLKEELAEYFLSSCKIPIVTAIGNDVYINVVASDKGVDMSLHECTDNYVLPEYLSKQEWEWSIYDTLLKVMKENAKESESAAQQVLDKFQGKPRFKPAKKAGPTMAEKMRRLALTPGKK